jgi:hypothetical protein
MSRFAVNIAKLPPPAGRETERAVMSFEWPAVPKN